ncbi:MAG: hypothetical protein WCD24_23200, partial [Serratia inhibens]|uniref:hypothetical protein n=1 Tax=Serratia inhibens TaxID=2338073 RepID=UPI003C79E4FA
ESTLLSLENFFPSDANRASKVGGVARIADKGVSIARGGDHHIRNFANEWSHVGGLGRLRNSWLPAREIVRIMRLRVNTFVTFRLQFHWPELIMLRVVQSIIFCYLLLNYSASVTECHAGYFHIKKTINAPPFSTVN